ncbi:SDR family NAD(P)-dependent oxidoreductase [Devosia marina]|uniref:SDR family NAD(P)-dependent oxidoreductase n=1 Tax=Devosia marina TaxID=2683198 RepID=UPI0032EFE536
MNKRALVTGGSAGLGAALVAELLAEGIEVISIDRDQPAGETPGLHHLPSGRSV